mgnify:CR=1 FL=1
MNNQQDIIEETVLRSNIGNCLANFNIQGEKHSELLRALELTIIPFIAQQREQNKAEYEEIFKWLDGQGDFPARKEGQGAYWWRIDLRKKLARLNQSEGRE